MRIFLSYTAEDLKTHADAVSRIVHQLGWIPVDHRYWIVSGRPSVEECKQQVELSDALVVLVAHRYGWVPSIEDGGDGEKSITWIEVDWAKARKIPVIPFLLDENAPWPPPMIEGLKDVSAFERLSRFKTELKRSLCGFFSDDPRSIEGPMAISLQKCHITSRSARNKGPKKPRKPLSTKPNLQPLYKHAIAILLEEYLGLRPDDEIVVIYDESANPYLSALFEVSKPHHLMTTFIDFPKLQQVGVAENDGHLPEGTRSAIARSSALVSLLDDDLLTVAARLAVLRCAGSEGRRIIHVPGLTSEILETLATSDIELINREAASLSLAIRKSDHLRIITQSATRKQFELLIDLSIPPQTHAYTPGRIPVGNVWNISLGVLELHPAANAASGTICINRSGPGFVVEPAEEAIFTFESSKLRIPDNPQSRLESHIAELWRLVSRGEASSWNTLTEISFGLNRAVRPTSMDPSVSTSSRGILGIGVGNNVVHGGIVDAPFYWDFTTVGATVWAGDTCVLAEGKLLVDYVNTR